MGCGSFLVTTRNNPTGCKIDWDSMDADMLNDRMRHYKELPAKERPKNLAEMAERWNETKFYGYLDDEYKMALREFCEHLVPYGSFPRLYYDYEGSDHLIMFEFIPGTGSVNIREYDYSKQLTGVDLYDFEKVRQIMEAIPEQVA
jgi:hypothetical protein